MQLMANNPIKTKSTVKGTILSLFLFILPNIKAQPVNPQPGENIWQLTASIGTELDACCSCNPIPLTLPTTGTTISVAGVYCLTQDQPSLGATDNITISQSNVVLDLNGHTITGGGSPATIYISSPSSLSNITIKNGSIISSSDAIATNNTSSYSALTLNNINIISATNVGLHLNNVSNSTIKNVQAHNCSTGFDCVAVANSLIESCNASTCSTTGFAVSGASAGAVYKNCENNGGIEGFLITASGNPRFESCSSNNTTIQGFGLFVAATLINCSASTSGANGFQLVSSSMNLINCVANNNSASGFNAIGVTGLFEQCSASFNNVHGFNFGNSGNNNNTLTNCSAFTNGEHGFNFDNAGEHNTTIGCIATNNNQNGFSFIGPTVGTPTENIVENCTATKNQNFGFAATTTFATAFFLLNKASVNVVGNYSINPTFSAPVTTYGPAMTSQYGCNLSSQ